MELRIAICDDAAADRAYIRHLTERWAENGGTCARISEYAGAEEFLFHAGESGCDILLLDIEMGGMDGVTLAKRLRRRDETMQIVFITGYSDYIAEGYEVSALHYLMKPVKEEKLFSTLDRAVERLRRDERALTLDAGGETVRVPLYKVRFIDVSGNYVTVHADGEITSRMTLKDFAGLLDERFFRVGRSAIVNLTQIARVTRTEIVLTSGERIPLPRGAYEGVNRAIIDMR